MIVLHDKDYNPKIDFSICKQLVKTIPEEYDEDKIRKCFQDYNQATEIYENDLLKIKGFFECNNVLDSTNNLVESLYRLCTHEDMHLKVDIAMVVQKDLRDIASCVNETDCQRNALFQILFLLHYCIRYNSPIIPYQFLCNRLFYAIIGQKDAEATSLFNVLRERTKKYMTSHSLDEGERCIRLLYENKEGFIAETGAIKLGYYGSYARGNASEYSDFDILAVFSDERCLPLCKRKCIEFWSSKLPIDVDVAVINQSNIDDLSIGIKRSVKFI